jgi:hypothetical protein
MEDGFGLISYTDKATYRHDSTKFRGSCFRKYCDWIWLCSVAAFASAGSLKAMVKGVDWARPTEMEMSW